MGSSADEHAFIAWVSLQAGLTDFFPLRLHESARYTSHSCRDRRSLSGRKSWSAVGTLPPLVGPGPVGPALVASETHATAAPHICRTDTTSPARTGLPASLSAVLSSSLLRWILEVSTRSNLQLHFKNYKYFQCYVDSSSSVHSSSAIYQSPTPSSSAIYLHPITCHYFNLTINFYLIY